MKDNQIFGRRAIIEQEIKKQVKKENRLAFVFYFLIVAGILYAAYFFYTDRYQYYFLEDDIVISIGADYQLNLFPKYAENFNSNDFEYEVEDSSVAAIDRYGKITALKAGTTNIIVKHKKMLETKKFPISVKNISVASVDISSSITDNNKTNSKKEVRIKKGETIAIKPKVNNSKNIKTKIKYKSSDSSIAKVDDFGNLTPVGEGSVTITAETESGVKENVDIIVYADDIEIESLDFSESNIILSKDKTKKLEINIKPNGASNKKLTWSSSDSNIVSVDQNGVIKGIKNGNAIIKVKSKNGVSSSISVYVEADLSINITNKKIEVGDSFTLKANKEVKWLSSNSKVASVDSFGVVVGLSEGQTTITGQYDKQSVKCDITVNKKNINVASVSLNKSQINMYAGDSEKVNAIILPNEATNKSVSWSTSDSSVATVDQNGNINAKKEGNTIIKVKTNNNLTAEVKVKVIKKQASEINKPVEEVINIYLNKSQENIYVNDTFKLSYYFSSNNLSNKNVTWSSNNSKVVSVDNNGNVKGLSTGTATITVTASNNSKANCVVNVSKKNIEVSGITLNKTSADLYLGDSISLIASISPSDATNKNITWSSSNLKVASVDSTGKVTALGIGNATITVTTSNGKTSKSSINVKEKVIDTKSITLDKTSIILYTKEIANLNASINPYNATNKNVSWSSSNSKVASISNGKVTAIGKGTATITASQGSIKSECKVTVKEPEPVIIEITELKMNIENTIIYVGDTINLSVTISPSNASNKSVSWKSSNNSVVVVDSTGKVKAVGPGQAIITAYSGNVKATSIINVREKTTPKNEDSSGSGTSNYVNPVSTGFEVTYYWGILADKLTDADVKRMKDAGITLAQLKSTALSFIEPNDQTDIYRSHMKTAINKLKSAGIKVLVTDNYGLYGYFCSDSVYKTDDAVMEKIKNIVSYYSQFSNVIGYDICDEPSTKYFNRLKKIVDYIKQNDSKRISYINMFPNYVTSGASGASDYTNGYLNKFAKEVNPQFLSVDHYPSMFSGSDINTSKKSYYSNLNDVKKIAKDNNMKPMMISLVTKHLSFKNLTKEEIAFQISLNLAYGMKRISYFTYSIDNIESSFSEAIVDSNHKPTNHYYYVKDINKWAKIIGDQLYSKKVSGIYGINEVSTISNYNSSNKVLGNIKVVNRWTNDSAPAIVSIYNDNSILLVNTNISDSEEIITFDGTNGNLRSIQWYSTDLNKWVDITAPAGDETGIVWFDPNEQTITLRSGHSILIRKK